MSEGYVVFWNDQGDSDILCSFCYNKLEEIGECYPTDQGETDSPMHCSQCHRPLNYRLTSGGVDYVIEYIIQELLDWDILPISGDILPWYDNCPGTEVVKDWAKSLQWYGLDDQDQELVDYFLEVVPDTLLYTE